MPIELNTKTPNTQTAETMFNKFTEVANDNTKAKDIQSKACGNEREGYAQRRHVRRRNRRKEDVWRDQHPRS